MSIISSFLFYFYFILVSSEGFFYFVSGLFLFHFRFRNVSILECFRNFIQFSILSILLELLFIFVFFFISDAMLPKRWGSFWDLSQPFTMPASFYIPFFFFLELYRDFPSGSSWFLGVFPPACPLSPMPFSTTHKWKKAAQQKHVSHSMKCSEREEFSESYEFSV